MKKEYKKVFGYGIIMIIAVLVIVMIAWLSENRLDDAHDSYQTKLTENKNIIGDLEKKIELLEDEKAELEKKSQQNMDVQAKLDLHNQIMNELTEIYHLIADGETSTAKAALEAIPTSGFDDGELAFYEALKMLTE